MAFPALGMFVAIRGIFRDVRPVHPTNADIDMLLVAGSYLQNPCNPVHCLVLAVWKRSVLIRLETLNRIFVCDKDKVFAGIFDTVYYVQMRPLEVY